MLSAVFSISAWKRNASLGGFSDGMLTDLIVSNHGSRPGASYSGHHNHHGQPFTSAVNWSGSSGRRPLRRQISIVPLHRMLTAPGKLNEAQWGPLVRRRTDSRDGSRQPRLGLPRHERGCESGQWGSGNLRHDAQRNDHGRLTRGAGRHWPGARARDEPPTPICAPETRPETRSGLTVTTAGIKRLRPARAGPASSLGRVRYGERARLSGSRGFRWPRPTAR